MLRLLVSQHEYVFSDLVMAYVLPDREMAPGNPASCPEEGAALYNSWIEQGCPGTDALSDFEKMVNYALSSEPGALEVAQYLLYVMGNTGTLTRALPESSWSMQLLFARNLLDTMDRASFLRLRNTLMNKAGQNE